MFEFRCPIHGFIQFNEWEREVIAHPVYQRLRRIRQLGWTDYVYPGAMHTRFEHSLGVMHVATRLFDAIRGSAAELLKVEYSYSDEELDRHRQLVRLAALLHDVGHGPFSHVAEDVMPKGKDGKPIKHELYSAAIVREMLPDCIEKSKHCNLAISAADIAEFLEGGSGLGNAAFWRTLLVGQMDADRMDYLLRDSYHCGVAYGKYDLDRLINTICVVPHDDGKSPRIGIREGGIHAAESLILARYYMFTQVYFHKTRVIYDYIVGKMMADILPDRAFPGPDRLGDYLSWDDWRVLGLITGGNAGEFGERIASRRHLRQIWGTPEVMETSHLHKLGRVKSALGKLLEHEAPSQTSWYKLGDPDIRVLMDQGDDVMGLAEVSTPVAAIKPLNQVRLYVDEENREEAQAILKREHLL